jgi:hypothetical protein
MANEGAKSRKRVPSPASQRSKSKSGRKAPAASAPPPDERGVEERIRSLEAECNRLRAELQVAQAEVARLKEQRDDVVNRIDWIIDSLHTIIDE